MELEEKEESFEGLEENLCCSKYSEWRHFNDSSLFAFFDVKRVCLLLQKLPVLMESRDGEIEWWEHNLLGFRTGEELDKDCSILPSSNLRALYSAVCRWPFTLFTWKDPQCPTMRMIRNKEMDSPECSVGCLHAFNRGQTRTDHLWKKFLQFLHNMYISKRVKSM